MDKTLTDTSRGTLVEQVDADGWYTPFIVDDWGTRYYYLRAWKKHGSWSHSSQDRADRLEPGDVLRVRWPDGCVTEETLAGKEMTDTIPDMGHSYDIRYRQVGIEVIVHGIRLWFHELRQLRVQRIEGTLD